MKLTNEQKMYHDVVQKAWEDADFKKELTTNPLEAIEKLTGIKLNIPEGKKIVVRDQTSESVVYINIPAEQKMDDVELNEEQLETVAGGMDITPIALPWPIFPPGGCFPTLPINPIQY